MSNVTNYSLFNTGNATAASRIKAADREQQNTSKNTIRIREYYIICIKVLLKKQKNSHYRT